MKSTGCLLCLSVIFLCLLNFKAPEKLFVPPGTVKVNDILYYDITEVSNGDWKVYVNWNKNNFGASSMRYQALLPDTTTWRQELSIHDPYIQNYYQHEKYSKFPLVGISYEQATNYCKWRTLRLKEQVEQKEFGKRVLPKSFSYRLPKKAEWEYVARIGFKERHQKYIDKKQLKRNHIHNIISDSIPPPGYISKPNPGATITSPVLTYYPNKLGIFNLIGNVAEMTSEKGIAKGGSWNDRSRNVTIEKEFTYDGAKAWLGFRCVCEVDW